LITDNSYVGGSMANGFLNKASYELNVLAEDFAIQIEDQCIEKQTR